jgi:DNA-binding NarL/FixJ family response regulator
MESGATDKIRVVVVDDHELVRRGLLAFLQSEPDLDVVGDAAGGAEALELLDRLGPDGALPDVVVMDLQMRPVDGIESTRMIRDRHPGVQVVALSSFDESERVRAVLEAGASGYVLKDSDADDVAAAIRAAQHGDLRLDPAVARRAVEHGDGLTARELDVLRLVGAGKANKAIARQLGISERTARTHVSNILRKLDLDSRTQAALWAVREGLAGD